MIVITVDGRTNTKNVKWATHNVKIAWTSEVRFNLTIRVYSERTWTAQTSTIALSPWMEGTWLPETTGVVSTSITSQCVRTTLRARPTEHTQNTWCALHSSTTMRCSSQWEATIRPSCNGNELDRTIISTLS